MDLNAAYALDPQVSLRPEPFGALAYHFGNRRLSFLRSPEIVAVVRSLDDSANVADALEANHIDRRRWPSFTAALATLESSDMIHRAAPAEATDVA
ncbi:MAG TPA: mycofactocin biosynthesis chaperone MftB [Acidimicrobiales bacterium]